VRLTVRPEFGEGPESTHCCHSRAEPNVALGLDGAGRRPSNLIGAVPTRRNSARANRASAPRRTRALDQFVWPIGVSIVDTGSHTAI
jgi:hypothetical protein